jgi:hypothetical protein
MLFYGVWFMLGMGYLILWQEQVGSLLHWRSAWIALIGGWAGLLLLIWWHRSRQALSKDLRAPIATQLGEGLLALGLLVCLIGGGIQWELILKGQGRVFVGVLWMAGAAASIVLARRNRRITIIIALRAILALLAIGAVIRQSLAALVAAGVVGVVLFLVGRYWNSGSAEKEPENTNSLMGQPNDPQSIDKLH